MPPLLYFLGVGALGALIGILSGGSSTPIVGTILPLIFGLIGGGSGIYIATVNPAEPHIKQRLQGIGLTFCVLCGCIIVFSIYAGLLRTGSTVTTLIPTWERRQTSWVDLNDMSPQTAATFIALRSRLELLHVPQEEQNIILSKAVAYLKDNPLDISGPQSLDNEITQMQVTLDEILNLVSQNAILSNSLGGGVSSDDIKKMHMFERFPREEPDIQ